MHRPTPLLTAVLAADAASCLGLGLLAVSAPGFLNRLSGLPQGFIVAAGAILLAAAALLVVTASRRPVSRQLLRLVVIGNALWVAASLATLALVPMTVLGAGLVVVQAAAVAVLTAVEARFLRPAASIAEGAA